jgi:hypothetical protein
MINHHATLSSIRMATSHSDTGAYTAGKQFYESVKARFLQQSARYLRTGITDGNAVSSRTNAKPLHHKVQGQYRPCC